MTPLTQQFKPIPRIAALSAPPRVVHLSGFGWFRLVGSIALLVSTLVLLAYWLVSRHQHMVALEEIGKAANARIIDKQMHSGKSTSYDLYFTYTVGGNDYVGSQSVSSDKYHSSSIGDSLSVVYLPSDPKQYEVGAVDAQRVSDDLSTTLFGAFMWLLFPLILAAANLYYTKQDLRLSRDCVPAEGVVTRSWVVNGKSVRRCVAYAFTEPSGQEYRRTVQVNMFMDGQDHAGEKIVVLYDPAAPKLSRLPMELKAVSAVESSIQCSQPPQEPGAWYSTSSLK